MKFTMIIHSERIVLEDCNQDKCLPVSMQMMHRRDELTFRQEMKFRNKLVEYLTDWIMGNSPQYNGQGDIGSVSRSDPSPLSLVMIIVYLG